MRPGHSRPTSPLRTSPAGRWLRLAALAAACAGAGCGRPADQPADADAASPALTRVRLQLDWRPEPEHGGIFQALARGWFTEEGLDIQWREGGPNVFVTQSVAAGQADIGQSASTQVLQARGQGFPLVHIAAVFHVIPTGLIMHESNPVNRFEDLAGQRIMGRPEAVYIPYLKNKYKIDFEVVPQNFGLGQFLSDPSFIQEGFTIAEPYFLRQQGARVKWLRLSDAGYTPSAVLFSSEDFLRREPAAASAFLRAYVRGWAEYLDGDYSPAHDLMKQFNPGLTDGFLEYCRGQILRENLVRGDPARGETIGSLDPSRLAAEISLLESLGLLAPGRVQTAEVVWPGSPR